MKNIKITKLSQNKITNCPHLVDSNYENLLTSISLFGILEPPIVFSIPNRKFQIVSGNRTYVVALYLEIVGYLRNITPKYNQFNQ
jgi:ParB-like chromosome segregation protein Spo0J